jgi:hypothetical protein
MSSFDLDSLQDGNHLSSSSNSGYDGASIDYDASYTAPICSSSGQLLDSTAIEPVKQGEQC